jgi:hypothetical protein
MNDLIVAPTTIADYIDRTFKQMGLVESSSDLLRHLQWEIEEYKEAEGSDRAAEAFDVAVLAVRLLHAVLNEAEDYSAANYRAFEKENEIRKRMRYALKFFKERSGENLPGATPYECYADAKKHLNQMD